jgi:hypothetical protein
VRRGFLPQRSSIPGGQQTGVPVGLLLVEMVLPARIPPRILTARTLYLPEPAPSHVMPSSPIGENIRTLFF